MTPPPTGAPLSPRGLFGMRVGVLLGYTSWILVLTAICLATGRTQYLLPVCLPMLLASLALGLLLIALVEPAARAGGPLPPGFALRLQGAIWSSIGLLTLLAEAFVVPMLADRALADAVRSTGGVLEVPRWIPTLALACGCALLLAGLRGRARAADQSSTQVPTKRCAT